MVILSEIINITWFVVGLVLATGGWVLFAYSPDGAFHKFALGLPILLIGISMVLMKINEIILVLVKPKRLEIICRFCQKNG